MNKKRILIAEDEEAIRALLAEILKTHEYEIDVAENGVEAMNHIKKRPYDLIITDYLMPEMDGLELTQIIKAEFPSTPILILTGNGPVDDFLESGAAACITKPFSIFDLQHMVKTLLCIKQDTRSK
jgi:CheY-like chemotaxis protein